MAPKHSFLSPIILLTMSNHITSHTDLTPQTNVSFEIFQRIIVVTSDKPIHVPVTVPIKDDSYCKELIAKHDFKTIEYLAIISVLSHVDLIPSVASYYNL